MRVKCITIRTLEEEDPRYPALTEGNIYTVYSISPSAYRIISDDGEPLLFDTRRFEVVDERIDDDWERTGEGENVYYAPSSEHLEEYWAEDYFNYVPQAIAGFNRYILEKFRRDVGELEGIIVHPNRKQKGRKKGK